MLKKINAYFENRRLLAASILWAHLCKQVDTLLYRTVLRSGGGVQIDLGALFDKELTELGARRAITTAEANQLKKMADSVIKRDTITAAKGRFLVTLALCRYSPEGLV